MSKEIDPCDLTIFGVSPNWFGMLLGLAMFLGFSFILRKEFLPNALEIPLFLAPMISCGVAYAIFTDAIRNSNNDVMFNMVNLTCALITTFLGVMLSMAHGWHAHLFVMAVMFIVFIGWDMFVVKKSKTSDDYKDEVKTAHKSINLPTLGTLALLTILLFYMEQNGIAHVVELGGKSISVLDLITTGAVAFHLGVAALGYVFAVTGLGTVLLQGRE